MKKLQELENKLERIKKEMKQLCDAMDAIEVKSSPMNRQLQKEYVEKIREGGKVVDQIIEIEESEKNYQNKKTKEGK